VVFSLLAQTCINAAHLSIFKKLQPFENIFSEAIFEIAVTGRLSLSKNVLKKLIKTFIRPRRSTAAISKPLSKAFAMSGAGARRPMPCGPASTRLTRKPVKSATVLLNSQKQANPGIFGCRQNTSSYGAL
ncbi:MAG: hypothetical protein J2P49_08160, partial [Methylocapsa sp.]|nr:hypothetical protein [Methylocapsa sp.]